MKISFIIPTLNEATVLEHMLTSLRSFSAFRYEIIVSDGGSTDSTVSIARRFADTVVVWDKPGRQNIAMGRNAGARVATGDLFVFIDADVFIPDSNHFFELAVACFAQDSRLAGLIPRLHVLPHNRTVPDFLWLGFFNIFNWCMNNILHSPAAPGEFQMIPAAFFKRVGGYDEHIVALEDMDIFMRLAKVGKTRLDWSLLVYHTGRRAHKVGWGRLWWQWTVNAISVKFFRRSVSKEWTVVR